MMQLHLSNLQATVAAALTKGVTAAPVTAAPVTVKGGAPAKGVAEQAANEFAP